MRKNPNPKIDRESPAWRVMSYWGTNSAFARALNRRPSTTQRWLEKGSIDPDYHAEIMAAARRDKKALKPSDFVDPRLKNVAAAPALDAAAA
jgi:hypothetical protein